MNLSSRAGLIRRLRRGKGVRQRFIESHLKKGIAYQLRATRDAHGWSQEQLATEVGMNQNAISRLESPNYGKHTITTLKRLAAALDVGLVVRLVPFSEMIDWVSGTPKTVTGLNSGALAVANFSAEEEQGVFGEAPTPVETFLIGSGAAKCAESKPAEISEVLIRKDRLSPTLSAAMPRYTVHQQQTTPRGAMEAALR